MFRKRVYLLLVLICPVSFWGGRVGRGGDPGFSVYVSGTMYGTRMCVGCFFLLVLFVLLAPFACVCVYVCVFFVFIFGRE